MGWIRKARAIGGLVSVFTLLSLLSAHVVHPRVEISLWVVSVLLSLVGALLAVDVFRQELPTITIGFDQNND